MELKHGIHKFEGIAGVNCYWSTSDEGVVIIDTANPKNEKKIMSQLEAAGKSAEDVKLIIITHADIDHVGSAAALKQLTGAKLAIHEDDAEKVKGDARRKEVRGFLRVIFKIMMAFIKYHKVEPDILLKDGDEIAGFRVLHTPGHTEGSIMFYRPDQVLITGDALLSDRNGQPRGPMKAFTPNMEQAWDSVRKVADLNFEMMLPGHGKPILENASDKVGSLIEKKGDNMKISVNTKDIRWWFWFTTLVFIVAAIAGWIPGYYIALGISAVQLFFFIAQEKSISAFPVQIRIVYLAVTLFALWPVVRWYIFIILLLGTVMVAFFGRCSIAMVLKVMPWNHGREVRLN